VAKLKTNTKMQDTTTETLAPIPDIFDLGSPDLYPDLWEGWLELASAEEVEQDAARQASQSNQ
jgi:hypothetical protein